MNRHIVKILFTIALSVLTITNSYAGLLGPSTYEECLLDNVKNAKTNEAVSAVIAACALKFQNKDKKSTSPSVKICKLYWDGWKFAEGERPNNDYIVQKISYLGALSLELSMPRSMVEYLEIEKSKDKEVDSTTKFGRFFGEHYPRIKNLCAFK